MWAMPTIPKICKTTADVGDKTPTNSFGDITRDDRDPRSPPRVTQQQSWCAAAANASHPQQLSPCLFYWLRPKTRLGVLSPTLLCLIKPFTDYVYSGLLNSIELLILKSGCVLYDDWFERCYIGYQTILHYTTKLQICIANSRFSTHASSSPPLHMTRERIKCRCCHMARAPAVTNSPGFSNLRYSLITPKQPTRN